MNRITEFVIEYHFLFNRFSHHDSVIFSKPDNIYKFLVLHTCMCVCMSVACVRVCFFFSLLAFRLTFRGRRKISWYA